MFFFLFLGNLRLSTMPCWPRLVSTTTVETTLSSAQPAENTTGCARWPLLTPVSVSFWIQLLVWCIWFQVFFFSQKYWALLFNWVLRSGASVYLLYCHNGQMKRLRCKFELTIELRGLVPVILLGQNCRTKAHLAKVFFYCKNANKPVHHHLIFVCSY